MVAAAIAGCSRGTSEQHSNPAAGGAICAHSTARTGDSLWQLLHPLAGHADRIERVPDLMGHTGRQFTQSGQTLRVLGKCLDVPVNATAGARVQIWDCNAGANQRWTLNGNGTITNAQTGLCLDVDGAGTANGTAVIVWSCHNGANQRWTSLT